MKIGIAMWACAIALSSTANADMEKIATTCDQQICFHWWPKIPAIEGWHHDRENSLHYNFNALAPAGKTFSDAETVMYANAVYKLRVPEDKTLASFIDGDLEQFRSDNPGLIVTEEQSLKTADGRSVRLFRFIPSKQGQWERVAYLEEGEFYVDFIVSSRTEQGLSDSSMAYEKLIARYREKP
jgi:hypothetical protein